jgi:tRNA(fMet)-specific endonuclease VapC
MVVLDTDHLSLLEWSESDEGMRLRMRLEGLNADGAATTIINYEEQMRGWMAYLAKAKRIEQQIEAYRRLNRHLDNYRKIEVLEFDSRAAQHFEQFIQDRIRMGTMDLKIAAIVLSRKATLLTCNQRDFRKVPGLRFEDWTK